MKTTIQPDDSCQGCVGRGTGSACCVCGHPIPASLRRDEDSPSELQGVSANMVINAKNIGRVYNGPVTVHGDFTANGR